jgi:hypothetical protein
MVNEEDNADKKSCSDSGLWCDSYRTKKNINENVMCKINNLCFLADDNSRVVVSRNHVISN